MIDLQTGQLQTVISVCKYDVFQHGGPLSGPANGQAMGQQRASKGPEEENIISIRNTKALPPVSPAGFDDWYSVYPNKKAKQAALRAFKKVIGSGLISIPVLIERTRAFAAATNWAALPKERRKYIPHPATWLNDGSYDDEPDGNGGEPTPAPIDPLSFTDDKWLRCLKYFGETQTWVDAWGPKPGAPGCLVPSHLIVTPVSASKGAA